MNLALVIGSLYIHILNASTHDAVDPCYGSYLEFCMSHCNEWKHGVHRSFQSQTSSGRIIVAADEDGGLNVLPLKLHVHC